MGINREQWLSKAVKELTKLFKDEGYTVPELIRASCGFAHRSSKAIGQCWAPSVSSGGYHEIFISPVLSDVARVLDVLAHEMVHAVVGVSHGHKAPFTKCAKAIGLTGKMTATVAGDKFTNNIQPIIGRLPEYPHSKMSPGSGKKKQGTRLIKGLCPSCGYTIRVTQKWIEVGFPTCPCGTKLEEG